QLLDLLGRRLLVAFEVGALGEIELGQNVGDTLVANALVHLVEEIEVFLQRSHEAGQICAFQFGSAFSVAHDKTFGGTLHHDFHELTVIFDVLVRLAFLDAVKRRLGNEHVAALDQLLHVAKEKRKQQASLWQSHSHDRRRRGRQPHPHPAAYVFLLPRLINSCMWRKKNVSSRVRMWLPSTSASVMRMTLP